VYTTTKTNIEHILVEQSGVLKAYDLQNIAETVKAALMPDIRKLISAGTAPLKQEIVSLKAENAKLRDSIDGLEPYGRRPLIRVTGINENDLPQSEFTYVGHEGCFYGFSYVLQITRFKNTRLFH
jgi:hypothetical protein